MAFASGRFSRAICDRCGQEYKYQQLKKEWNGLFVCPECYEPKHPQLDPPPLTADAEALHQPRPEVDLPQTQLGLVKTTNQAAAGMTFQSDPIGSKLEGIRAVTSLGSITVSIT